MLLMTLLWFYGFALKFVNDFYFYKVNINVPYIKLLKAFWLAKIGKQKTQKKSSIFQSDRRLIIKS